MKVILTIFSLIIFAAYSNSQERASLNDTIQILNTLNKLDQTWIDKPKEAIIAVDTLIQQSKNLGFKRGLLECYYIKAGISFYKTNFDTALSHTKKTLAIAKELNDSIEIAQSYYNIGIILYDTEHDFEANKTLLKVFDYVNDSSTVAIDAYTVLGDIQASLNYYDKAKNFYQKAYEISKKNKDSGLITYQSLNLAGNIFNRNDTTKFNIAKKYLIEAQNFMPSKDKFRTLYIKNLNRLYSKYYYNVDSLEIALSYIKTASKYADAIDNSYLFSNYAEIYIGLKKYSEAEHYLKSAEKNYKQIKVKSLLSEIYLLLSELYHKTNKPELAYEYLEQYRKINDSIKLIQNSKIITTLTLQYETEKKDNEINKQRLRIKQQENTILKKKQQNFLYFVLVIIGVIVISLFIVFWLRKVKRFTKQEEFKRLKAEYEVVKRDQLIEGVEEERNRLAIDLHDGINGDLAALKFKLQDITPKTINSLLPEAIEVLDNSIENVRNISYNLIPPSLKNFGFIKSVKAYCEKMSSISGISINFLFFGKDIDTVDKVETTIYRILQELINNIILHAKANNALIQMNRHKNFLYLTIEDDGIGFNPNQISNGFGLKTVKSRIEMLKGKLDIESNRNGTSVNIEIDLDKAIIN